MDLRSQLEARKKILKPTKTVLTDATGDKYEIFDGRSRKLNAKCSPFVVDDKPDMRVGKIVEGLFIGSQDPATCEETLKLHRIGHVLSLGVEPSIKYDGINYSFVDFLDIPEFDVRKILAECLGIVDRCRKNNIFVHCNAGVSRSATVVVGYLMAREELTYDEAYERVKNVRNCVKPNDGFARQLRNLSNLKDMIFRTSDEFPTSSRPDWE